MSASLCLRALCALAMLVAPARGNAGERPGASEVEGRSATVLLKRPTASIRVYTFRSAQPRPIPFQVDERDSRNHWADDLGPQPVRDDTPGIFDENDVVVFMNRDLGEKGEAVKLPVEAAFWLEVRVGPKEAPFGYAYVGSFDSPPALPNDLANYSRYEPATDQVFADRYTVRFDGPMPSYLTIVQPQGEDGPNVLKGVRAHGEVRILAGLLHFARSEKDLLYTIQGYRNGPVRAIRSAKYWIPLPLGFKARARVELLFYRDFVEGRARVNIKIPPRLIPADGTITAYFDFHDFAQARVTGPAGTLMEPVNGSMTDAKRAFADKLVRWSALLLPSGQSFLLAVRLGGSLQRLDQQLYLDDSNDPERGKPSFGFHLSGINRLSTGEQDLSVNAMILNTTYGPQVSAAAGLLLDTPEVAVTALGLAQSSPDASRAASWRRRDSGTAGPARS